MNRKELIKLALKIFFVAGLFYFMYQRGFFSLEATQRAFQNWNLTLPAMALLATTSFLAVIRWHWLLQAQGIRIPFLRTVQLVFIGNFFNIALPGAVSGDFVKAFYVAKEVQGLRGRAFGSILFDRVAGLSALVLVAAGALGVGISHFLGTPLFDGIRVALASGALAVIAFYGYLFFVKQGHDPLLRVFKTLETKNLRFGSLTRIYEGIRHYHDHRATVVKVLLLSALIHTMVAFACLLLTQALGETSIAGLPIFVIVPLGMVATAIPLLPAGVGTGHAAFTFLFLLLGSKRGADVFNLVVLTQVLIGAAGGIVYLRFRSTESAPDLQIKTP